MFIGMYGHGFITSLYHSLVTLLSNFKQVGSLLIVLEEEDLKTLDWQGKKRTFICFDSKGLSPSNNSYKCGLGGMRVVS